MNVDYFNLWNAFIHKHFYNFQNTKFHPPTVILSFFKNLYHQIHFFHLTNSQNRL